MNMVHCHSGKHLYVCCLFFLKALTNLSQYYIQGCMGVGDKFLGKAIHGRFPKFNQDFVI